jgi:hypothetical protein
MLERTKLKILSVGRCRVKGQWEVTDIHLEASFVYLLQICHKGCAMPPQDVLWPEICVH